MRYIFSALNSCEMRIERKRSIFSQWGLSKMSVEVKTKMSFLSERQNYYKEQNYSLFAFLL